MSEHRDLKMIRADKAEAERAEKMRALQQMRDNLAWFVEYHMLDAKIVRARFNALVAEGFTEAQAIDLCKKP